MVSGAYRATPIQLLESETGILPLRDYLAMLQAQYQLWKTDTPVAGLISSACERIRNQLREGDDDVGSLLHLEFRNWSGTKDSDTQAPRNETLPPRNQIRKTIYYQWANKWAKQRDKVPPDKRVMAHKRDNILKDFICNSGTSEKLWRQRLASFAGFARKSLAISPHHIIGVIKLIYYILP